MSEDRLLTTQDVADWLQIDERTVSNMAARGELSGAKIARKWRFSRDDVLQFIERQRQKGAPQEAKQGA